MPAPKKSPRPDADFKLSITKALADQLKIALDKLTPVHLTDENLTKLEARAGVYTLWVDGELVYVGKAAKELVPRLRQHMRKFAGRNMKVLVSFTCLYVDEDLEASAPERMLIKRYLPEGRAIWNTSGFGNKDPGRQRDTTRVKAKHFDAQYPINVEFPVKCSLPGSRHTALTVLERVKKQLPFLLRFSKSDEALEELRAGMVTIPSDGAALSVWLQSVLAGLSDGWQVTVLPGYVIMYREARADAYESALLYWRKEKGTVIRVTGPARFAEGEVKSDEDDESVDENEKSADVDVS
ncbi:hypothetical protein [Rhodococcus pyridinivorans]|uniref:hypothetical protein n=1 Tax=Rhodococcus pyridinivorans TaxID=103816 RepID=UPI000761C418|nr:hypothetical protein [Rhodococcus pyridinivorans]